jgi:hypothetical protein
MTEVLAKAPPIPLNLVMWRPDGKPTNGTCRYVAYIDARHAADALDDWVGPLNWTVAYSPPDQWFNDQVMWCRISIRSGDEWVTKSDIGIASNFQKEKGLVSDAFKRAAVAWGVGRNIYDLPMMWASCKVGSKGQAFKDPKAEKEIETKLKAAGYDVSGVVVDDPDTGEEPVQSPEPVAEPQAAREPVVAWARETSVEFRAEVLKLRERINLLDEQGKEAMKLALASHGLNKTKLKNCELSEDQLAALWKIEKVEGDRMGEPFGDVKEIPNEPS